METADLILRDHPHPIEESVERLRPQGVPATLAVRANVDEAGLMQDAQVTRHAGLLDVDSAHEVVDGSLAGSQGLEKAPPGRVREGDEDIEGHRVSITLCVYTFMVM